jgi:hypothetical protein
MDRILRHADFFSFLREYLGSMSAVVSSQLVCAKVAACIVSIHGCNIVHGGISRPYTSARCGRQFRSAPLQLTISQKLGDAFVDHGSALKRLGYTCPELYASSQFFDSSGHMATFELDCFMLGVVLQQVVHGLAKLLLTEANKPLLLSDQDEFDKALRLSIDSFGFPAATAVANLCRLRPYHRRFDESLCEVRLIAERNSSPNDKAVTFIVAVVDNLFAFVEMELIDMARTASNLRLLNRRIEYVDSCSAETDVTIENVVGTVVDQLIVSIMFLASPYSTMSRFDAKVTHLRLGQIQYFFHDNSYKILETTGAVVVRCYRAAMARLHLHLTALVQIFLRQLKSTDVFSNRVRHLARDPMISECLQLLQSLSYPSLATVVLDGDGVATMRYSIHFICGRTFPVVKCGPHGKGYKFLPSEAWLRSIGPMSLVVSKLSLGQNDRSLQSLFPWLGSLMMRTSLGNINERIVVIVLPACLSFKWRGPRPRLGKGVFLLTGERRRMTGGHTSALISIILKM